MAEIIITKKIESSVQLTEEMIDNMIEVVLKKNFDHVKRKKDNSNHFSFRLKSFFFFGLISVAGFVKKQIKDNKILLMIELNTKTTGKFWFSVVIGLFIPPYFLVLIFEWFSEKKKISEMLTASLEELEFNISELEINTPINNEKQISPEIQIINTCWIKEFPNTGSRSNGELEKGESIIIVKENEDWYFIAKINDPTNPLGWIKKENVKK